jgi:hypothetical protein
MADAANILIGFFVGIAACLWVLGLLAYAMKLSGD